ncbi:unnamed protein product [Hymenolepis diminuta]|uniref:Uncharacterized protein n=1 Tax=Hymenolepis diminuta TaxID=6216 RepID=A0A564Z944_HYMDI|nr:unnamed protein product [Hymenolepis diminuta]
MKYSLLLIFIMGFVFSEFSDAIEFSRSMDKRGLHFFRLRRSERCVEVSPEMLQLVATHGLCPLAGGGKYGPLDEN